MIPNLSNALRKLAEDVQFEGLAPHLQAERIAGLAAELEAGASPMFDLILASHNYARATLECNDPFKADSQVHRQERAEALLELEKAAMAVYDGGEDEEEDD